MQKYYNSKEDKDGDFVTVNHTRYTVTEIDPARVHIPIGREADMELYNSQDEFLEAMGLSPVEGHVFPEPEPEPVYVPQEVTNFQLKQALNVTPADRAAVDAMVAGSGDQNIIDGWEHASTFKRSNVMFTAAVTVLGWSEEKVDQLMILSATFE
jgi:hypothetical protein